MWCGAKADAHPPQAARLSCVRILLVEDEDSIRSALTRAFERDGHEVRAAASLAEARSMLSDWSPELAVSDLKLPDGDGLALVGTLGIPVVMLSGYATYDDAVRALRCGAVDFFTKPVSIKDVRAAIARARPQSAGHHSPSWSDPEGALAVIRELVVRLSGRVSRLVAAELVQAAPTGHLHIQVDETGTRLWLDAPVDWSLQADRTAWLRAHPIRLQVGEVAAIAVVEHDPAMVYNEDAERLWPEDLVIGRVVQAHAWQTVGSWLLPILRAGAGPFAGLSESLRRRCEVCGISVQTVPLSLVQPGVGGDERAGLLAEDGLGAPIA
jgi:DNA-binding response OmpR family regulator